MSHRIVIEYCPRCRWLLRAAWYAQELLTTFETELAEVSLRPAASGVFRIMLDEELLADRARDHGFADLPILKQQIRDRIAPMRDLGHTDRRGKDPA